MKDFTQAVKVAENLKNLCPYVSIYLKDTKTNKVYEVGFVKVSGEYVYSHPSLGHLSTTFEVGVYIPIDIPEDHQIFNYLTLNAEHVADRIYCIY